MARNPLRAPSARRFSLAGLLIFVSVAAVLLAPVGTIPRSRLRLEAFVEGAVAAALSGLVVGFVVLLCYPQTRLVVRLLGMLLGAATAFLAAVMCMAGADARMLAGGTAVLVAATFVLRLSRIFVHEQRAAAELKRLSAIDKWRE